ncbi:MAG: right-handed parallel beta-helix repeat-containing protein [Chloroflexi bacterium]|nr:right-handed parallel beta-helix repeat-containing protein [Chloroflexota bacterium]
MDSTADAVDANPGDGLCATAAGACTLRAAIQEANALPGPDTISLPAGVYTLTIDGAGENGAAQGDLDINESVRVEGAGAGVTIINGNGNVTGDRVFDIASQIEVTLSGLNVSGGKAPNGGGIYSEGLLTVTNSTISGNTSGDRGGGIYYVSNTGNNLIQNSTLSGNEAAYGGAFFPDSSQVTIEASTASDNSARKSGGAAYAVHSTVVVRNSTLSGNQATENGGALYNYGSTITVESSTITGNAASAGGGMAGGQYQTAAPASSTPVPGAVRPHMGTPAGANMLRGSILAGNSASNSGPDCSDTLDSGGYNLVGNKSGCNFRAAAGDQVGTAQNPIDPRLSPLQDNGGPTFTHALLPGSPAIDRGDPANCPSADQRGYPRPVDGDGDGEAICDVGAYESGSAPWAGPAAGRPI